MKVLLLGGTGTFGERLARLLVRDGHQITIAGRNLRAAQALAAELGCAATRIDRDSALPALAGQDVLIDAAGPFHAYGAQPYRLARAAIAAGVHYLDLSDNAAFCANIRSLDDEARAAGVCVMSGLSSVPGLSSAAVRALAGTEPPRVIDIAILPGNRSPRGLSVMASILTQAGRPFPIWRAGRWCRAWGWSEPRRYRLPDGQCRQAWLIEVPDLHLFPEHFGAATVMFRAGLELSVLRYGLAAFALLRRAFPFRVSPPLVRVFKRAADLLLPFGSGRGGMSVMVAIGQERRFWRLLTQGGDGPFVPAIPIRALLRRAQLPSGAQPAVDVITLDEAEAAMADLSIRFERAVAPLDAIFPRVLGPDFAALPALVRATYLTAEVSRWRRQAAVRRGTGGRSRLLAWAFRFPPAVDRVPVEVVKRATAAGETWHRQFGTHGFRSFLAATADGMTERFGPFTFRLGLHATAGAVHYAVRSGRLTR